MPLRSSILDKLRRIRAEAEFWGERFPVGASEAAISDLRGRCHAELSYSLPERHAAFLRIVDGLDFNGFVIYSSGGSGSDCEDLVHANLLWRDDPFKADFVIMAESGIDLFGHRPATGELFCADRTSFDVFERYASVDDLIEAVLDHMINV